MTHKLIKTFGYLLIVDGLEVKEKAQILERVNNDYLFYGKKIIAHLPLEDSDILEGVDLLDINLMLNYLKEFGYWSEFSTFVETFYNEKKHIKNTN